jgi:HEAT repeats
MVRIEIPEEQRRPEIVREALRGRVPKFPASLALDIVSELDVSAEEQRDILREALTEPELEPHVRVGAIHSIAKLEPDLAVSEMVRALESPDTEDEVAAAAATVLGRIGGPEQLPQLERLKKEAASDLTRQRAAFAEGLIVHRFGLTDHEVEPPAVEEQPEPEPVGALTFIARTPGGHRRKRALAAVHRQFPALDPTAQDLYELQCGPRLMEVVVSRDAASPEGMSALTERPAMPAVVAFRSEETADFYPALVVLTTPQGGGEVSVLVAAPDGTPALTGRGAIRRDEAELELRSVKSAGLPAASVRVRASAQGVEISGVSDASGVPAVSPERIEMPQR